MSTLRLLGVLSLLAGLDVAATVAIKQAVVRRDPIFMVVGIGCMIAVAGVLALAIEATELTVIALGWIILFQVLIVVVDRLMYGVHPGTVQMIALVVALIALTVAAIAPSSSSSPTTVKRGGPPRHARIPSPLTYAMGFSHSHDSSPQSPASHEVPSPRLQPGAVGCPASLWVVIPGQYAPDQTWVQHGQSPDRTRRVDARVERDYWQGGGELRTRAGTSV